MVYYTILLIFIDFWQPTNCTQNSQVLAEGVIGRIFVRRNLFHLHFHLHSYCNWICTLFNGEICIFHTK